MTHFVNSFFKRKLDKFLIYLLKMSPNSVCFIILKIFLHSKILPCSVLASCTAVRCKILGIFSSSLFFPLLFLPVPPTFACSLDSASIVYFSFKVEGLFIVTFLNEKNIS